MAPCKSDFEGLYQSEEPQFMVNFKVQEQVSTLFSDTTHVQLNLDQSQNNHPNSFEKARVFVLSSEEGPETFETNMFAKLGLAEDKVRQFDNESALFDQF